MTTFLESQLKQLIAEVSRHSLGPQPETDPLIRLPDVVIAKYPATYDGSKITLLIYGHYDVQPAGNGWTTDPWVLEEKEGKLYGRGSTDDKGPVLAWLNALRHTRKRISMFPLTYYFALKEWRNPDLLDLANLS